VERSATGFSVRVPKAETPRVAARLLGGLAVTDLVIEEPPIESVVEQVFESSSADVAGAEVDGG
jgi:ABC-2 type transport system ATP-binding protein